MFQELLKIENINLAFNNQGQEKLVVIEECLNELKAKNKCLAENKEVLKEVITREGLSTTGFGKEISIPHGQISMLKEPVIGIFKYQYPVNWNSLDGQDVILSFYLLVPKNDEDNTHLKIISKLARLMMDQEFVEQIKKYEDKTELYEYLITKV